MSAGKQTIRSVLSGYAEPMRIILRILASIFPETSLWYLPDSAAPVSHLLHLIPFMQMGQRRLYGVTFFLCEQFLGQMEKPDVESIEGLPPAISIDQKSTNRNPRSTVGTVTEIYDYSDFCMPVWESRTVPNVEGKSANRR